MGHYQDLTGQKFNRITVLKRIMDTSPIEWLGVCDCGTFFYVRGSALKSGNTKSCGCYSKEETSKRFTTHGARHTRLYRIHTSLLSRCLSPTCSGYPEYGGQGVTICEEWKDFTTFQEWALTHGYTDKLTIDRRDNSKGYLPDNCRWATKTIQARNRRAFKGGTSQYIGVSWNSEVKKWNATICVSYQAVALGRFHNEIDAALARDNYIIQHKLEGYPLNF